MNEDITEPDFCVVEVGNVLPQTICRRRRFGMALSFNEFSSYDPASSSHAEAPVAHFGSIVLGEGISRYQFAAV